VRADSLILSLREASSASGEEVRRLRLAEGLKNEFTVSVIKFLFIVALFANTAVTQYFGGFPELEYAGADKALWYLRMWAAIAYGVGSLFLAFRFRQESYYPPWLPWVVAAVDFAVATLLLVIAEVLLKEHYDVTHASSVYVMLVLLAALRYNRWLTIASFALGLVLTVGLLAYFVGAAKTEPFSPHVGGAVLLYLVCGVLLVRLIKSVSNLVQVSRIAGQLAGYLPPKIARSIERRGMASTLGGQRREVTVLFSDLKGFTTLSEQLPPEQVVSMLNEYFTEMVRIVFKHDGMIGKFIGDAVMAIYGAPDPRGDHAQAAVATALEMREALAQLNLRRKARGEEVLEFGIGLHSGEVIAGNIGSLQQFEYTVIGDTVNTASRLQSLTRNLGVDILMSDATWQQVRTAFGARDLGEHEVKGRSEKVRVVALLGRASEEHGVGTHPGLKRVVPAA
jgi:class 3 adenylate cyclase